ncbi:MAG: hypothetical protein JOZ08_00260 [Verrucomicrobia bacterium]|nr:hypothetical protein [Verrucomicrobiota bacterium]
MSEAPSQPATPSQPTNKRPVIITVICVIGFIGALFTIPILFSHFASDIGAWYPPFVGLSAIVGIVSFIGLWRMRLWGLYLYLVMFVIAQAVMIATHIWSPFAPILPIIVLIVAFSFRSRMQ